MLSVDIQCTKSNADRSITVLRVKFYSSELKINRSIEKKKSIRLIELSNTANSQITSSQETLA